MRISTSTLYSVNLSQLNTLQGNLMQTQQQISTGRRILTPADDPSGAAQVIQLSQTQSANTQYLSNIGTVNDAATFAEGTLQGVTNLVQNIQTTAVNAGSAALSDSDRKILANTLSDNLNQLMSMANSTDSAGNYLFSGFKGNTQPFVQTATGVQYNGDSGQRMIQVSANSQIPASDSGANIFMQIKNGNGTFVTGPSATNTGSGIISSGSLVAPAPTTAQLGNTYTITFAAPATTGGSPTYTVTGTDATGAALPTATQPGTLPTAATFTSGQAISFNGVQFDIQGTPAAGDKFTVAPSSNESLFSTISNLITTLNMPTVAGNAASQALRTAGVNHAMDSLNSALNNVLTVRATLGSRMNECTAMTNSGNNMAIQYTQSISTIQDVDYNKAITDLTQQKTILQAAQQSFVQVENLSLFNYLR